MLKKRPVLLLCFASAWFLLRPSMLSARLPVPEGTEDLHRLASQATVIVHATVLTLDAVYGPTTLGNVTVQEAQVATLSVDRWYKGGSRSTKIRLTYVFPGYTRGYDCVDLHRSASWLIFAQLQPDGSFIFSDSCEGGLPMSAMLAPTRSADWEQQLQRDLVAGLEDADPSMRLANIARLGGLKLKSSSDALRGFAEHGTDAESKWATYAMLRADDLRVLPSVENILINMEQPVWGSTKTGEPPAGAAPSGDPDLNLALELERNVHDRGAVPSLIRIFESARSEFARTSAIGALQDIKDPRALPAAAEHLNDSSILIQHHVLATIYSVTKAPECAPPNEDANIPAAAEQCRQWWKENGGSYQ
jgi:hypothetical protein